MGWCVVLGDLVGGLLSDVECDGWYGVVGGVVGGVVWWVV